jgi:DNA modification methylase
MELKTDLYLGDCRKELKKIPDNSVDLIVTSPPYADQRKTTYGGISVEEYVDWFLPVSKELLRVLKPTGTFILNIKEKVVDGERSTYVMELILEMRKQGWLWTEEFIWHKKNCFPGKWSKCRHAGDHLKNTRPFCPKEYSAFINLKNVVMGFLIQPPTHKQISTVLADKVQIVIPVYPYMFDMWIDFAERFGNNRHFAPPIELQGT